MNAIEEIRELLIRLKHIQKTYGVTNNDIYNINWHLENIDRNFNMKKKTMNDDIKNYDIFILTPSGKLQQIFSINSINDYNHYQYNLHHYIRKQDYEKNTQWYEEREIKQKLLLLPTNIHEQLHFQAIKNLSDEEFEAAYKISRWDLIFNKNHSKY